MSESLDQPIQSTLVMKFGGTSVGDPAAFRQAVAIIAAAHPQWQRLVVVTSAMAGVTNQLLESAQSAAGGDRLKFTQAAQDLRIQHFAVLEELISDLALQSRVKQDLQHLLADFLNLCQAIAVLGEATPRALDAVSSLGERMAVRVLAAVAEDAGLPAQYIEATELIATDDCYQNAHPDLTTSARRTNRLLLPILSSGRIPVITGFIGADPKGIITTLGRGGSDFSAAILGAILPADEVWIWTDVNGVMTADPRLVPSATTVETLSYREVAELAYYGAKVLHPKTIRPVIEAGIGLRVCNTFIPDHPGTRIVADSPPKPDGVMKAVTAIRGLTLITLEGRGMLGVPGVAARTFAAVATTGTSVPLITQASSEQSICFAVPVESTAAVTEKLASTFAAEIASKDIDRVWATGEVGIITIVGAGMQSTPGVAGRVFSSLGDRKVNVIAVAQGSSEVSISLVVTADDLKDAVSALHELIVPTPGSGRLS